MSIQLGFVFVSQISRDEVAHLARLARLALTEVELDHYAEQLDVILTYISTISSLDLSDTTNSIGGVEQVNITRSDQTICGLTSQQALAGAPSVDQDRFVVPQILGESQ